jgi:hypothetical protein
VTDYFSRPNKTEFYNRYGYYPKGRISAVRPDAGFSVSVNVSEIDAFADGLLGDVQDALRPAVQVGAQVLYNAVLSNVASLGAKTGNLEHSIYQAYSTHQSSPGHVQYEVSWNPRKAPHGYLVENGHIQRYASYVGSDGKWHTAVRPSAKGKPRPGRNAGQAAKDAYYVLRQGGPLQVAPAAFVRSAAARFPQAMQAVEAKFTELMK